MLVINNIEKLEHKMLGQWSIEGVKMDSLTTRYYNYNYTIKLSRKGVGAAIIIERTEGEFGYNVSICYENYDNVISITPWPKDRLIGKANFMASMRGVIDAEYDKKN